MRSTNREESYAEAVKQLEADEKFSGIRGVGEIVDEGELSKAEVARLNPIVDEAHMEAEIDKRLAEEMSFMAFFGARQPSSRADVRAKIERENERARAAIAAAPEEHIYDFRYHA